MPQHNDSLEQRIKRLALVHLTDDELAAHHDGVVRDELMRQRVEAHLQRCLLCQRRLAFLKEVTAEAAVMQPSEVPPIYYEIAQRLLHPTPPSSPSPAVGQRIKRWADRAWRMIIEALSPPKVAGVPAHATGTRSVTRRSKGGELDWIIVEAEDGGLTFAFYSRRDELAGCLLEFACVAKDTEAVLLSGFTVLPDASDGRFDSKVRISPEVAKRLNVPYHPVVYPVNLEELTDDDVETLRWSVTIADDEASRKAWRDFCQRLKKAAADGSALCDWCEEIAGSQGNT